MSHLLDRRRLGLSLVCGVLLALMSLAPTPGDVGGCQPARPLDESAFFEAKRGIDCDRCEECGLSSDRCDRACADQRSPYETFPDRCAPLAHDGAVCLRALIYATCDSYAEFVDDGAPRLPSECDFCPLSARATQGESQ